jgi:hypothetical protein
MSFPAQVAVDASAAQDAGRLDAIPCLRLEEVHDCRSASDRDFLSAMAVRERLVLLAGRDAPEQRRAQQPRDASQKVACRLVMPVYQVPRVESG